MKAGRLVRKTQSRKTEGPQVFRHEDADVIDLTADGLSGVPLISLRGTKTDISGWCAHVVEQSPVAVGLFQYAAENGWSAGTADLDGGCYHLDVPNRLILIDHHGMTPDALIRSPYFRNGFLIDFIRALRDVWHEENHGAFERRYRPENVLMLERIRAADIDTAAVQAAWELRGAGYADIWRHLLGSDDGDMAVVFTRYLERDPGALFDGSALAYAFRQWYANHERMDSSDHMALEHMDDILMESAAVNNPFGNAKLDERMVESMAVLPDGTCYLAGLGLSILSDPFFAGLNDAVNQTHLLQLVHDMQAVTINNVSFRDANLARRIFPEGESVL